MTRSQVPLLVLAALAGCNDKPPVVESSAATAPSTAPPASPATSTAPVSASAAPVDASTAPETSVPERPTAWRGEPPFDPAGRKTCKTDRNCTGNEFCYFHTTDAGTTGYCRHPLGRGRPLVVDGVAHVAPYSGDVAPVTSAEIADLLASAREEHASIAAFARTIAELMALGAPLALLAETQAALADEIRHTSLSLAMLARLTGEAPTIAPLTAAVAPLTRSVEDFFRDVLRGGAVGETRAAADAEARAAATSDPSLHAFYDTIMRDEARHAALAFKTLRWLLATHPALASVLADERAMLSLEERTLVGPLFDAMLTA